MRKLPLFCNFHCENGCQIGSLHLSQPVFEELSAGEAEEENHARKVYCPRTPECRVVAPVLGEKTAHHNTQSDAYVPRYQQGRVSRSALLVRGEIYKHSLEGGEHMTISQADDKCRSVISPQIMHRRKKQISKDRHHHSKRGIFYNLSLAQGAAAHQA